MQTVKDFLYRLKNSEELIPRQSFIDDTKNYLKQAAANLERKQKIKKTAFVLFSTTAVATMVLWFTFFGGSQFITNTSSHYMSQFVIPFLDSGTEEKEEPLVFIYHTHTSESYLPLLDKKGKTIESAFDNNLNITFVGEKFVEALQENGVYALHDKTNITTKLEDLELDYSESYNISRELVESALEENSQLKMIFDVHRDSQTRRSTTTTIDGVNMAQILFIVSSSSDYYEENLEFVNQLHDTLEQSHPGLSRGVFDPSQGRGRSGSYNLDLFPQSSLLEIGGFENTLDEVTHTVEILAEVIATVIED